jgi:ubiquinone/menaquinone biosynthesis C-methylase UbiE
MNTKIFYDNEYLEKGLNAQRRYPNEELCRFMGRNYFNKDIAYEQRKNIKILEIGCGSCANLWMPAKEGFDVYGCDLSENAITLGQKMLEKYNVAASLVACNMLSTPYEGRSFDTIIDVFSSYCLCRSDYILLLQEIKRILKHSGIFFSYFPSKQSDTFIRSMPEDRYDEDTLHGIRDNKSPYFGNDYLFRFMSCEDVQQLLSDAGFTVRYIETIGRTSNSGSEYFEWVVFEAVSC